MSGTKTMRTTPCQHTTYMGTCGSTIIKVRETHAWCSGCGGKRPIPGKDEAA